MSATRTGVSALESQKKLLIAACELNRARLLQEWQAMAGDVRTLTDRARPYGILASHMRPLVTGLATLASGRSAPAPAKASWFHQVNRVVSAFWPALRSQGADSAKQPLSRRFREHSSSQPDE